MVLTVAPLRGALGFSTTEAQISVYCGAAKTLTFGKVSAYSRP
jgi:hypothetical protein